MAVAEDKQASALGWAEAALAAPPAPCRHGARFRHGLASLSHPARAGGAPRSLARFDRRPHPPRHPCLHGDLCRDRRSVPAWRGGAHACRRIPLRVVLGRARLGCSRHDRRHRHLPHRPQRARRAARRPRRALACEAPRRISRRMLSAISCSCASSPSSRFGSSISPRRFLASAFRPTRLPLSLASFREVLPIPSQAKG